MLAQREYQDMKTKTAKVAKLHIAVLEFTCPYCGEHIAAENGSHMFPVNEPLPNWFECDACGRDSEVPAKAKQLLESS